jgi:hypothetical protein
MPGSVPEIQDSAEIEVRAPAAVAFEVIASDLQNVLDEPDSMTGHRPVDGGPMRKGFRWRQWIVHERRRCMSDWVVTSVEPPFHLQQSMWHFCAVAKNQVTGGERWDLTEQDDGSTLVSLRAWTSREGLTGWLEKLLGGGGGRSLSLRKRLAYVQFEAERQAGA